MEVKAGFSGLHAESLTEAAKTIEIKKDEGNCSKTPSPRHEGTSINKEIDIKDDGNSSKTSSPRQVNSNTIKEDEELLSTKLQMGEVKEENQRLRNMLEKIEKDYRSLQMRYHDVLQHEPSRNSMDAHEINEIEEPEISLRLGMGPVENTNTSTKASKDQKLDVSDGLSLGLDFKCPPKIDVCEMASDDPSHEAEETKGDEVGESRETWPPSKAPKTIRTENEGPSTESNVAKRARVSVRARCDTPTMHDGCQWRKYGQKTAKGNPCPRAYYRCTLAPSCPVRKQVQRSPEDMSILITTYEGTHNHPLPIGATSMASTTSAAASILLSRSSTSSGVLSSTATSTASTANINGLNFTLFDASRTRPFNLPNAASPTPPTIVLDLTTNPSTPLMNRVSQAPKFNSTSLDFTSSSVPAMLPTAWSANNYMNYHTSISYNKSPSGTLNFAKPPTSIAEQMMQSMGGQSSSSNQQFLTETLTKVLTSASSFQSAVAAAISNMVGSGHFTNSLRASTYGEPTGQSLVKWGENGDQNQMSGLQQLGKSCTSSYHDNPSHPPMPANSTMVLQSNFPLSLSKSSSSMTPNNDAKNNSHI
ncbi:hypothetical protein V2J09_012445 [Rumex salicifolius]